MLTDDDEILASAQQRLLARRAAMTTGGIPAPLAVAASRVAPLDPRIVRRIDHAHPEPTADERAASIRRALKREIPARFTWSRWDAPELAQHVAGGAVKVAAARRALADRSGRSDRVVLLGAAAQGKTSLACAHLRERIEAGVDGARFVATIDLLADREGMSANWAALALSAHLLVLDDLGAELDGAAGGSGVAAQRIGAVSHILAARHNRDLGHVVTTSHERPVIARLYGDGVARRVFEGATVIRCRA